MRKTKNILLAGMLIIFFGFAVIAVEMYFYYRTLHPRTEDAELAAKVINVTSLVNGTVDTIYVKNHDTVHRGQLLFKLDPKPFLYEKQIAEAKLRLTKQQLQAARETVQALKAQIQKAEIEINLLSKQSENSNILAKHGDIPQLKAQEMNDNLAMAKQELKSLQSRYQEALYQAGLVGQQEQPEIQAAQAELGLANYKLAHTAYYAPMDGEVTNFRLHARDLVAAGQPLFNIISRNFWVVANFTETNLARIRVGQKATVAIDMYPNVIFQGHVTSISPNSGVAFSLLPAQNASGNWVKVSQRFPVKVELIDPDPRYKFRLGASCMVTIDTRS